MTPDTLDLRTATPIYHSCVSLDGEFQLGDHIYGHLTAPLQYTHPSTKLTAVLMPCQLRLEWCEKGNTCGYTESGYGWLHMSPPNAAENAPRTFYNRMALRGMLRECVAVLTCPNWERPIVMPKGLETKVMNMGALSRALDRTLENFTLREHGFGKMVFDTEVDYLLLTRKECFDLYTDGVRLLKENQTAGVPLGQGSLGTLVEENDDGSILAEFYHNSSYKWVQLRLEPGEFERVTE